MRVDRAAAVSELEVLDHRGKDGIRKFGHKADLEQLGPALSLDAEVFGRESDQLRIWRQTSVGLGPLPLPFRTGQRGIVVGVGVVPGLGRERWSRYEKPPVVANNRRREGMVLLIFKTEILLGGSTAVPSVIPDDKSAPVSGN